MTRRQRDGWASYVLPYAKVQWQTSGTPWSADHGDIYWSEGAGPAEKLHVFIEGNQLRSRWQTLGAHHFTLCEVGFGFGLNFLLAANLFRQHASKGAILNYLALEYRPVSPANIEAGCGQLPLPAEIDAHLFRHHLDRLTTLYPLPSPGFHNCWIDDNICLTLILGDAADALPDMVATADAWFLDGFSPATNPAPWSASCAHIARLSRPGATFATYSVAGAVRQGLTSAGFKVEKKPGFGRKLEMLAGALPGTWQPAPIGQKHVAIVGAGIAGLACADALARRNIAVTVFDRAPAPLGGASRIPALAVHPQLGKVPDYKSLFSLAAFQYMAATTSDFRRSGRCELASTALAVNRLQAIGALLPSNFAHYLSATETSVVAGIELHDPSLYFPGAGWRQPAPSQFAGFEFMGGCEVTAAENQVVHWGAGDQRRFDAIVLTTGALDVQLMARHALTPVRGQALEIAPINGLQTVIGGPVSIIPAAAAGVVGGTYDNADTDLSIREADTRHLTKALGRTTGFSGNVRSAWTGIRCVSQDRFPLAGAMPDFNCGGFDGYQAGNYLLTALGSHGGTTAPLLGEHVARLITGEANCLGRRWTTRLDGWRFVIRDARRSGLP